MNLETPHDYNFLNKKLLILLAKAKQKVLETY